MTWHGWYSFEAADWPQNPLLWPSKSAQPTFRAHPDTDRDWGARRRCSRIRGRAGAAAPAPGGWTWGCGRLCPCLALRRCEACWCVACTQRLCNTATVQDSNCSLSGLYHVRQFVNIYIYIPDELYMTASRMATLKYCTVKTSFWFIVPTNVELPGIFRMHILWSENLLEYDFTCISQFPSTEFY
jgi:hypothetical protein